MVYYLTRTRTVLFEVLFIVLRIVVLLVTPSCLHRVFPRVKDSEGTGT